ncbi:MAG: response regulator transcription factor [Bacteroidales bacterium]|nr:response regulator transcription factor [Bacteroidales bacterium]
MDHKTRILLVEDDINLGFLLVDYLESQDFDVKIYNDGVSGLKGFQLNHYDLCIVDIMLPKMDGFTLIEKIKEINKKVPIVILSARSMKEDKIKGFGIGVDDYITKPFDEEELLYRIKAILNRIKQSDDQEELDEKKVFLIGSYEFDFEMQVLNHGSGQIRLTNKEANILRILCEPKGRLVKRETLMVQIWGDSDYFTGRSLDVFISKLRKYLKNDPDIRITSIQTVGYILEELKDGR